MIQVLGLVGEDEGHFQVATRLIDDAIRSCGRDLDEVRMWQGRDPSERWYKSRREDAGALPRRLPDGRPIRRHGKLGNQPELRMWRDVLYLFAIAKPRPGIVVLCRDMDADPGRRQGMTTARAGDSWPFSIVIAAPDPEIEAWLVAGFTPRDEGERRSLDALRKALSFDPTTQSHRLTSRPNDAKTDAKRVLDHLCGDDRERREACLDDRAILRLRGMANGLTDFLDEIDQHIVPLFRAPR